MALFKPFELFSVLLPLTPWTAAPLGLPVVFTTVLSWAGDPSPDTSAEGDCGGGPATKTAWNTQIRPSLDFLLSYLWEKDFNSV